MVLFYKQFPPVLFYYNYIWKAANKIMQPNLVLQKDTPL